MNPLSLTIASVSVPGTLSVIWDSLGVFAWLFLFAMAVIVSFLAHGWLLLGRHVCPFETRRRPEGEAGKALARLARDGMDPETVRKSFFAESSSPEQNLFYTYLCRFGQRDRRQPPSPSLVHASDEQYEIARVANASNTARFLAMVLPALGLLGTLIGMFNAFFSTNLDRGDELAATMQTLMQSFALALFTTIIAVILKIAVDLFNHFTLSLFIGQLRAQLGQLRTMLLDLASQESPPPAADAEAGPAEESGDVNLKPVPDGTGTAE